MSALHQAWEAISEPVKHVLDALSFATVVGTLFNMLPQATALLSFVYLALRIYESKTVQRILASWRMRRAYRAVLKEPIPQAIKDTLKGLE